MLLAAVIVVAMLLCTAVARLGGAAAEKSRANNAADASALAAADRLALGRVAGRGVRRRPPDRDRQRRAIADLSLRGGSVRNDWPPRSRS